MSKSLEQLFAAFLYESEFVRKVRPETLRGYTSTFNLFMKIQPGTTLQNLDSATMISFFRTLQERKRTIGKGLVKEGVKKSTIATYHTKLNCFFTWLAHNHHIKINPLAQLPHPTPVYEDKKFLKKEDIEKIIAAVHLHHDNNILLLKRNLVLFYLLLFCGLRKEELLLLQIRDIDFERKCLTVRSETSKSGASRQIPLHSQLLMHLKDYLKERKQYATPVLIVSSKRDDGLTDDGLKHLIQKFRTHSGVCFHAHQFRHTFALNFLKTSNNIAKLKQLLGHRSLAMTLTYLRCLPVDELRGDIEEMSLDKML